MLERREERLTWENSNNKKEKKIIDIIFTLLGYQKIQILVMGKS